MTEERDPDIVRLILDACQLEGFDPTLANMIERKICEQYGGRKVYIPKKKRISQEGKQQAFADGLSNKSTQQIVQEHGISRATLYRLMKKG